MRKVFGGISSAESVALVGPNGAGKTTLFLCLAGVLGVRPGTVRIAGLDPADPAARSQLPRHVGVVFSDSDDQFVNPTLADDVAFGPINLGLPPDEVQARVAEAIASLLGRHAN